MAFFGVTTLGYQEPFHDQRLDPERPLTTEPCSRKTSCPPLLPPISKGSSVLNAPQRPDCSEMCLEPLRPGPWVRAPDHGSFDMFQKAKKRGQLEKAPNQMYRVPLTAGQNYGWWIPREPGCRPETAEPWIRTPHHPMLSSPMTKFVDQMTKVDRTFSLF